MHAFLAARVAADLLPGTVETLDELLGADDRWTDPAAVLDPSKSAGRSPEAVRLRRIADDLVALLDFERLHLVAVSTPAGLMRYHHWMADSSRGRLPRLLGVRSSMMAADLLAATKWGPELAFAGNAHVQLDRSSMRLGDRHLERRRDRGHRAGRGVRRLGHGRRHDPPPLASPVPRLSPWYGYAPLDPAGLSGKDGVVFVKDGPGTS